MSCNYLYHCTEYYELLLVHPRRTLYYSYFCRYVMREQKNSILQINWQTLRHQKVEDILKSDSLL